MRDRSPVRRPRAPSTSPSIRPPKLTPRVGTILPPRVPGNNLPAHNLRIPVLRTVTFPAETDPRGRRAGSPTPDVPPHPTAGGVFRPGTTHSRAATPHRPGVHSLRTATPAPSRCPGWPAHRTARTPTPSTVTLRPSRRGNAETW